MREEKKTTVQPLKECELFTTQGGYRAGYRYGTDYEVQEVRSTGGCRIPQIGRR